MAREANIPRPQGPSSGFLRASQVQIHESDTLATNSVADLILLYSAADSPWAANLAECLNGPRFGNSHLRLSLAKWNPSNGLDDFSGLGVSSRGFRFLGIIFSSEMLREDWPAVQLAIKSLNQTTSSDQRIVTILKDNISIPPMVRQGEWFDFRNANYLEESLSDLLAFLKGNSSPVGEVSSPANVSRADTANVSAAIEGLNSLGVCAAGERVLSNLFPVVEFPKFVYSVETRFRNEAELTEVCAVKGPLPFLLKGAKLYTIEPPSQNSAFAPAVSNWETCQQENFGMWLSTRDRADWAIELLNNLFRHHAWKRGLRYDRSTDQYYFPRTKPKSIWWETGGRTVSREVTAPHMGWIGLENEARAEVQYGWKHRGIRAGFVQISGNLFLNLEPSWLLTELDGKTPATTHPVGPVFSGSQQPERNGQFLRSLRFWSAVLAKGHHEIRINTGQAPIRAKLTPLSGFTQFGIPSDQMDYDQLMLAEMEDDLLIPALSPLGQ